MTRLPDCKPFRHAPAPRVLCSFLGMEPTSILPGDAAEARRNLVIAQIESWCRHHVSLLNHYPRSVMAHPEGKGSYSTLMERWRATKRARWLLTQKVRVYRPVHVEEGRALLLLQTARCKLQVATLFSPANGCPSRCCQRFRGGSCSTSRL